MRRYTPPLPDAAVAVIFAVAALLTALNSGLTPQLFDELGFGLIVEGGLPRSDRPQAPRGKERDRRGGISADRRVAGGARGVAEEERCAGGAAKDDEIEIQGDHVARVAAELERLGYRVRN